jgi:hypothetical protein
MKAWVVKQILDYDHQISARVGHWENKQAAVCAQLEMGCQ